jgi:hypothetical protein
LRLDAPHPTHTSGGDNSESCSARSIKDRSISDSSNGSRALAKRSPQVDAAYRGDTLAARKQPMERARGVAARGASRCRGQRRYDGVREPAGNWGRDAEATGRSHLICGIWRPVGSLRCKYNVFAKYATLVRFRCLQCVGSAWICTHLRHDGPPTTPGGWRTIHALHPTSAQGFRSDEIEMDVRKTSAAYGAGALTPL